MVSTVHWVIALSLLTGTLTFLGCATPKPQPATLLTLESGQTLISSDPFTIAVSPSLEGLKGRQSEVERALDQKPVDEIPLRQELMVLAFLNGDFKKAKMQGRLLLMRKRTLPQPKLILALIAIKENKLSEAEFLLTFEQKPPANISAQVENLKGLIAYHRHDLIQASLHFKVAMEANPKDYAAKLNWIIVHYQGGQFEKAYQEALTIEKDPSAPADALLLASQLRLRQGNKEISEELLESVATNFPANPIVLHQLAVQNFLDEDREEALATSRRALAGVGNGNKAPEALVGFKAFLESDGKVAH